MEVIQSTAHWSMVLLTMFTVALAVLIHFSSLNWLSTKLPFSNIARRRRVLLIIAAALLAHIAEIWLFGSAYWLASMWPEMGALTGTDSLDLMTCIYFSAATFSTVGYGDLAPIGPMRFLAGTEALAGFVLITWTASFTYLEMRRDWSN